MDDLDKQLAELALLNNSDLPVNPSLGQHGTLGKKIGPAVPPKPKKQQPQVPQSYSIKQNVEPSYASRLQATSQQYYSNLPHAGHQQSNPSTLPSLTHSNVAQHTNSTYANIYPDGDPNLQYSNLPRAGMMHRTNLNNSSVSLASNASHSSVPMGGSLGLKGYNKQDQHVTYSNVHVGGMRNQDGLIYSNLMHPPARDNLYSNMPPGGNIYTNGG